MPNVFLLLFLSLFGLSAQKSTPSSRNYVGAVVEYLENENSTVNLENYVTLIQDAALQGADIIVFPELALKLPNPVEVRINGMLEEYRTRSLQPELYNEFLVTISSAAMENDIYVVINLEELLNCTGGDVSGETCPEKKIYIFNTNLVFDRTGAIIDETNKYYKKNSSRYRKINLFGETSRIPALSPHVGMFETDFGVTFGHFIGFDLLFQVPAIQIIQKYNITDIVFPARWYSELPFLSAVSIQQAYSLAMNVNFLAAGVNDVMMGATGSGIYSGSAGAIVSMMTGIPTTRLLVATVPKTPGWVVGNVQGPIYTDPSNQDSLRLATELSLPLYKSGLLSAGTQYDFMLTDKDMLCHFRVKFNESNAMQKYRYRAAIFSGVRTYNWVASGGSRVCAIIACTNSSIESCGERFDKYSANSTAIFETLEITTAVPTPETDELLSVKKAVYFPITLDTSLLPLKPADYTFLGRQILDNYTVYGFLLKNLDAELYSFGIWGREYTRDGEEPTNNGNTEPPPEPDSSNVQRVDSILFLFLAIVTLAL